MAFASPRFLTRLIRPFATTSSMGNMSSSAAAAAIKVPEGAETATLAAGCFWGVEHMYRKHFGGKNGENGLYDARVGYIGGKTTNPTYESVCSGSTNHAEAVQLVYNPDKITYRQLLEFFFRMHDPTTVDAQGPDQGSQYRSAIFYHNAQQEAEAREVKEKVNEQWWRRGKVVSGKVVSGKVVSGKVVTKIEPAGQWWNAEEYHQRYLDKKPNGYQCENHIIRDFPELK